MKSFYHDNGHSHCMCKNVPKHLNFHFAKAISAFLSACRSFSFVPPVLRRLAGESQLGETRANCWNVIFSLPQQRPSQHVVAIAQGNELVKLLHDLTFFQLWFFTVLHERSTAQIQLTSIMYLMVFKLFFAPKHLGYKKSVSTIYLNWSSIYWSRYLRAVLVF